MSVFATEFPINSAVNKVDFIAMVIAWVRGMRNSSILSIDSIIEKHEDETNIQGDNGEQITVKEVTLASGFVVGARYEVRDQEGRLWRTEFVLTNKGNEAALRVRGQCLAVKDGARVEKPKRPYLIKATLKDRWGGLDWKFEVTDQKIVLTLAGC